MLKSNCSITAMIIRPCVAQVAFKNCTPFSKFIANIDRTAIDNTEDLDLVMLIYSYSESTASLWSYSKDEETSFVADNADGNNFTFLSIRLKY